MSHHVARGPAVGLSLDEIERVRLGSETEGWSADERHIIDAVDQVLADQELAPPTAAGSVTGEIASPNAEPPTNEPIQIFLPIISR